MSDNRVNIKTDEATRDRLRELKRDSETWDAFLNRAARVLEHEMQEAPAQDTELRECTECGAALLTWMEADDGTVYCLDCGA